MAKIHTNVLDIKRSDIAPDPEQPRKHFDEAALKELARSLQSNGLLQPIVVRPNPDPEGPRYILIAGERRFRAAGLLGWETIPAIVHRNISSKDAALLQLLENIVRRDLNSVEEARALKKMLDDGYTMKELTEAVGMVASQVSWRVQMLSARDDVLDLVAKGHLKPAIAHELSKLSHNGQGRALRVVTSDHLSYNEVLALCQRIFAEENQIEMFPETRATEAQKRVMETFGESFRRIAAVLSTLQKMEDDNPGLLAESLATQAGLVEAEVDETLKALYRIKKALQANRMHQLAEVV